MLFKVLVVTLNVKLVARDAVGRILKVKFGDKKLVTPTFFPVINPHKLVIEPREIKKKFKWNDIITNSYILWKSKHREDVEKLGLHRFLNFDGIVFTDSGAYQIWRYGDVEVSNKEIVEFQKKIGSDIATFLDIPMPHTISKKEAERGVRVTLERAEECAKLMDDRRLWVATVQGSVHTELVVECAKNLATLPFTYYASGSLKIATDEWRFKEQIDYLINSKINVPKDKPFHFWGLGHPATFALFVAMGVDSFDSASYVLYAEDDRYMTIEGTLRLEELEEFPCHCPVCSSYTPDELRKMEKDERVRLLAEHNLWVILSEIRRIRNAIKNGYLWELVQQRIRAHPRLLEAFTYALKKYPDYFDEFTPLTKKSAFFYSGPESELRPEVRRAKEMVKRVSAERYFYKKPFGKVPLGLRYVFPFGQSMVPDEEDVKDEPEEMEQVLQTIQFLFGRNATKYLRDLSVERSKNTGMIRKVFSKGKLIGVIRPEDGFFLPNVRGASLIKKGLEQGSCRVVISDEAVEPVSKGRSVFSKFVLEIDRNLKPYQEVIVVDKRDDVIAVGKLLLAPSEVKDFKHHVVVKVRHGKFSKT